MNSMPCIYQVEKERERETGKKERQRSNYVSLYVDVILLLLVFVFVVFNILNMSNISPSCLISFEEVIYQHTGNCV